MTDVAVHAADTQVGEEQLERDWVQTMEERLMEYGDTRERRLARSSIATRDGVSRHRP